MDREVAGVSGCCGCCGCCGGCCCCRSCRPFAAIISGGGCSCGSCEWPVACFAWLAWWLPLDPGKTAPCAGVEARPTPPARLLDEPLMLLSAWRINMPIDPSFFFVVGIILSRIDTGARRRSGLERNDWRWRHAVIVYLFTGRRVMEVRVKQLDCSGMQRDRCQTNHEPQASAGCRDSGYYLLQTPLGSRSRFDGT